MNEKIKIRIEKDDLELVKQTYDEILGKCENICYEFSYGKGQCIDFDFDTMLTLNIMVNLINKESIKMIIDFLKILLIKNAKVQIKTKKLDASFENITQENVELIINNLLEKDK